MCGQLAVDHRPGHHENRFHVEQDEQHRDHVKAHTEAAAGIAHGLNAALVGGQLGSLLRCRPINQEAATIPRQAKGGQNLHQQREILPVVGNHRRPVRKESRKIAPARPGPRTAPIEEDAGLSLGFQPHPVKAATVNKPPKICLQNGLSSVKTGSRSDSDKFSATCNFRKKSNLFSVWKARSISGDGTRQFRVRFFLSGRVR